MSANQPTFTVGAARQYTESLLGGPCSEQESFITVPNGQAVILNANPDRVGLLFLNVSLTDAYVGLSASVSSTQGIYLPQSGGNASFDVHDDFTLPSRAWYGSGAGSPATVYCLEVFRVNLTPAGTVS